ncbi:MAG: thiazole synthase [Phycisphaeraceae bacterium]|nr:thiazole synthase [Phycisphaeraceae bacterium]
MRGDSFVLAGRTFRSRLIVGTGKYRDYGVMREALAASGAEVVTVAVRRERLVNEKGESLLDQLDLGRYTILPNTAGCFSAEDAVRVARLGRDILEQLGNSGASWVKLEVLGDRKTLLPDPVGTLEATRELVKDGFQVLAYTSDDPISAVRIKEAGAACVMPAGSPIGSGQGVLNRNNVVLCLEGLKASDAVTKRRGDEVKMLTEEIAGSDCVNSSLRHAVTAYPVIVDAGVGAASDVSIAMELGADGVLLNTAIAHAKDPVLMAHAMRHATIAGRQSYLAGRIPKKLYATASSPWEGTISYIPGE